MEESILNYIGSDGSELISVITPVSICMFIVVLLISSLYSPIFPQSQVVTAANLIYNESESDSTSTKLTGALENAAVFILIIALVTFLLVLLYYYKFTNFLVNYMRFSTFFILFSMGGGIFVSVIRVYSIRVDVVSFCLFMVNFAVIGVMAVFGGGGGMPIAVTQGYTVILGVITAAWFTQLPEWTTWVVLVALAVYDLVAVLVPGGPLKILVELAQSRNDELPALVYDARPTVRVSRVRVSRGSEDDLGLEMQNVGRNDGDRDGLDGGVDVQRGRERVSLVSDNVGLEIQNVGRNEGRNDNVGRSFDVEGGGEREREGERVALVSSVENSSEIRRGEDCEDGEETITRGIRLGLGDFVFYSVLVGRAAMYDLMTVYACYLAIISGLACTLMLLAVFRRALPALPISIALGVMFYFLTRLLMEPFVVQTATNLLMF